MHVESFDGHVCLAGEEDNGSRCHDVARKHTNPFNSHTCEDTNTHVHYTYTRIYIQYMNLLTNRCA